MDASRTWLAALLVTLSWLTPAVHADDQVRVRLKNGGFLAGTLARTSADGNIALSSEAFVSPLSLDANAIRSIDQLDRNQPNEQAPHTFLLAGGNSISGQLVSMDAETVTVKSPSLGDISFPRKLLREFSDSRFEGRLVYSGPRTGADWKSVDKPDDWLFEAGSISTSKSRVGVIGDVNLPAKSEVRFSLSWTKTPDFALYLGCSDDPKAENNAALCLEIWDSVLTMVREVGQNAEIAMVSEFTPENNRLNLVVYLDQVQGVAAVANQNGKLLERIELKSEKATPAKFVKLVSQVQENYQSVFRLERFEVREWDGHLPTGGEAVLSGQIISADGQSIDGSIGNFDSATGEVQILRDNEQPTAMKFADIRRAQFSTAATPEAADKPAADTETKPAAANDKLIEVELKDRSRLTGKWLGSKEGVVSFEAVEFSEPIRFDIVNLAGMVGSSAPYESAAQVPASLSPKGRLIGSSFELPGTLAEHEQSDVTTLFWQADSSAGPVALADASEGKIEFGSASKSTAARAQSNAAARAQALPQAGFRRSTVQAAAIPRARRLTIGLELRTGDVVEGTIKSINEKGVTFESPSTTTKFVPHSNLESVTLRPNRDAVNETPQKLERLMTVPRSMKADPPTHLFVSTNGDYLRGRLVSLDETKVVIEVRLENVEIPTEQLAQIYWLHDRSWEKDDKGAKPAEGKLAEEKPVEEKAAENKTAEAGAIFQVHAIRKDGRGLTFAPEALSEGKLVGTSQLLGRCEQSLAELQVILFGRDVGAQARALKKELWTLSLAQLPKVYQEGESGAGESQSPLVGKPAPDFKLESIDGSTYQLSQQLGKVVVLDFWASWCGPCMKTMPEVDRVVKEVGGNDVTLVAVNLQEGKERINTALGRLAITANVLMDIDGEIAQQYQANAIPQTVIIDRAGNVAHLFVGGGPKFVEQFSAALKATLDAK